MKIEFIDIGNLNYVYKISCSEGVFFLKQALPNYRKKSLSMDDIPLKEDRLSNEVKALNLLKDILDKPEFMIPSVLFFDKRTNLALFSEVKGKTIKYYIDRQNISINHAVLAGKLIGYQHSKTLGKKIMVRPNDDDFFKKVIYFRTVSSSNALPESKKSIVTNKFNEIISQGYPEALINGDYSPKHLFIDKDTIGICDLEFVCNGDPAYDVGFFLAHYRIAEILNPSLKIEKAIKSFLQSYFSFIDKKLIEKRLNFYIGTGMINRVDGVVRDKRFNDNVVKNIRQKAIEIVKGL